MSAALGTTVDPNATHDRVVSGVPSSTSTVEANDQDGEITRIPSPIQHHHVDVEAAKAEFSALQRHLSHTSSIAAKTQPGNFDQDLEKGPLPAEGGGSSRGL